MIRTREGAQRRYTAIYRQCARDLAGGLSFGMDWPTLRSAYPQRATKLRILARLARTLPARRQRVDIRAEQESNYQRDIGASLYRR